MRIISWNLLHANGATLAEVRALILSHHPDLLLMQETTKAIDALPSLVGGHYTRLPLPGRHHGLAAWSRHALHQPPASFALRRGLIVRRVCQIVETGGLAIANVHLSHGQILNRLQLHSIAATLPERAAILGDCNLVGAPFLRGFVDAGPREPTHRASAILPLRLDRCFLRGVRCVHAAALPRGASDHRPILVELSVPSGM